MLINVTQTDINKGTPGIACSCPIAQAIKREQNAYTVAVWMREIKIDGRRWHTTKVMAKFITDFDNGKIVKPHCFKI